MSLKYWVDFFDDLQQIRGRSLNTVMAYRRDLELYAQFADTKQDIRQFYSFMKKQKLSTRSQARVISSLRTYLKFCETKGDERPELRELRPPKVKVGLPQVLSLEEFKSLLEACRVENPYRSARNQLTLLMLFGVGCRVSELIAMDLKDFNEIDGHLVITGKGNKQRLVPLTDRLLKELKIYLSDVRQHLVKKESEQAILINDRGHRPSRVDIWRWLAAWSAKAGAKETINPHKFRHGCATALLESGADLKSIQMLLGHASLQTTQIYTNVTTQRLVETVQEHHPLSKINEI
ncbi:MAG: tyrosine-type recombinase/integrase [Bdellovibrionales bacterium]